MNYLTNYYKNLSEQLQAKVNALESQINEYYVPADDSATKPDKNKILQQIHGREAIPGRSPEEIKKVLDDVKKRYNDNPAPMPYSERIGEEDNSGNVFEKIKKEVPDAIIKKRTEYIQGRNPENIKKSVDDAKKRSNESTPMPYSNRSINQKAPSNSSRFDNNPGR